MKFFLKGLMLIVLPGICVIAGIMFAIGIYRSLPLPSAANTETSASIPVAVIFESPTPFPTPTPVITPLIYADEIFRLINLEREKAGIQPLQSNSLLNQAAVAKMEDMLNRDYFSHTTPDGEEPWIFLDGQGYDYSYCGENISEDYATPRETVAAWMESEGHRANILSPAYTETGIAVAFEGDRFSNLVVNFFASPR